MEVAQRKILRQNEWQLNGDNCCGMIRIIHGARETQKVKKIHSVQDSFPKEHRHPFNKGAPAL